MTEEPSTINSQPSTGEAQLALIEGESDEALLLPREMAAKVYTGTTCERLESKRRHILDLIACGMPVHLIEKRCGTSHHMIKRLGQKFAGEIARNSVEFAQVLKSKAAGWVFLADEKAPDAKFHELMVGAGIAIQRAEEMEARTAGTLDPAGSVEVSEVNERAEAARKWIAARMQNEKLEIKNADGNA